MATDGIVGCTGSAICIDITMDTIDTQKIRSVEAAVCTEAEQNC